MTSNTMRYTLGNYKMIGFTKIQQTQFFSNLVSGLGKQNITLK